MEKPTQRSENCTATIGQIGRRSGVRMRVSEPHIVMCEAGEDEKRKQREEDKRYRRNREAKTN
jgi:hypothetical protein